MMNIGEIDEKDFDQPTKNLFSYEDSVDKLIRASNDDLVDFN